METTSSDVETILMDRPRVSGRIDPKEGPMRILVATDGSRGSDAALRLAVRLASRDERPALTVVTVGGPADGEPEALQRASRQLQERGISAKLRHVHATSHATVPETIAREAERLRAELVIVGSEGRDTLQEWVVGGVALRLIYLSRCPVLVVRAARRRRPQAR
jgi:nucleotide-binding universal stress UspA family protein